MRVLFILAAVFVTILAEDPKGSNLKVGQQGGGAPLAPVPALPPNVGTGPVTSTLVGGPVRGNGPSGFIVGGGFPSGRSAGAFPQGGAVYGGGVYGGAPAGRVYGGGQSGAYGVYGAPGYGPAPGININRLGGDIFREENGAGAAGYVAPGYSPSQNLQRGVARVSVTDQLANRNDRRDDQYNRDSVRQDQGIGRRDQQTRSGQYQEQEQDQDQYRDANREQNDRRQYDRRDGSWNQDSRRQQDQETRRGDRIGQYDRHAQNDQLVNDGSKALGSAKTAFIRGDQGAENIRYNFVKDFAQKANERGGFRELNDRNDGRTQVYREKQRNHRFSNSDNDAFRRTADSARNANQGNWLQNAQQGQALNNQFGNADRLQDAAAKQNADFETTFDRQNDRISNRDRARDAAYRGAQDVALREGRLNKDAIANANGGKGVRDGRYYQGREDGLNQVGYQPYGAGAAPVVAGGPGVAGPVVGGPGVAGPGVGRPGVGGPGVGGPGGPVGAAPVAGPNAALQGGAVGGYAPVKRRDWQSGGNIQNVYSEDAVQGDLGNQLSNNAAESGANAGNVYDRDRGLQDSIQNDRAAEGKWAKQKEGYRDNSQQGYNADNARAARNGEAIDNSFHDSASSSSLDARNNNFDQARLDRINLKSNQIDGIQNIRNRKEFYHDNNQQGYNNEDLNYNRARGNNDFGAQEAAQKEARTRSNNYRQHNKNSRGNRLYEDIDQRRVSNGDAFTKRHNANDGKADSFARARDEGRLQSQGFNKNKAREEFDRLNQLNRQKNEKLWDRANRDLAAKFKGQEHNRRTNAAFQYRNDDLGASPYGRYQGSAGRLGSRAFGTTQLGRGSDYQVPGQNIRPNGPYYY